MDFYPVGQFPSPVEFGAAPTIHEDHLEGALSGKEEGIEILLGGAVGTGFPGGAKGALGKWRGIGPMPGLVAPGGPAQALEEGERFLPSPIQARTASFRSAGESLENSLLSHVSRRRPRLPATSHSPSFQAQEPIRGHPNERWSPPKEHGPGRAPHGRAGAGSG